MPKPRRRDDAEFADQFVRVLRKLRKHLESAQQGDPDAWQDVSVQLFMLLCDRIPVSLAERIIPDLSFHPLLIDISTIKQNYLLIEAIQKRFTSGKVEFELFDLHQTKIPLTKWLEQTLLYIREETPKDILDSLPWVLDKKGGLFMTKEIPEHLRGEPTNVTLYELIREARNQMGGGHFTPTIRAIMQATESINISEKVVVQPFHAKCLIAIAHYVSNELSSQSNALL